MKKKLTSLLLIVFLICLNKNEKHEIYIYISCLHTPVTAKGVSIIFFTIDSLQGHEFVIFADRCAC